MWHCQCNESFELLFIDSRHACVNNERLLTWNPKHCSSSCIYRTQIQDTQSDGYVVWCVGATSLVLTSEGCWALLIADKVYTSPLQRVLLYCKQCMQIIISSAIVRGSATVRAIIITSFKSYHNILWGQKESEEKPDKPGNVATTTTRQATPKSNWSNVP